MAATIGGRPGRRAYAASKGAIDNFAVGFAKEVAREGIRGEANGGSWLGSALQSLVSARPK
jgi:short-subunit dehydrogenase